MLCDMPARTPTHQLIESRLGGRRSLARFVAERRKRGLGWRAIAHDVCAETGIAVSHEALRSWFGAKREDAA